MPVNLSVVWPDKMGAARKFAIERQEQFRQRFRELVSPDDFDEVAKAAGVSRELVARWYKKGTSQPDAKHMERVAKHLGIKDSETFFFGGIGDVPLPVAEQVSTPAPSPIKAVDPGKAPRWMHEALDDAYSTPYSDFIHLIVSFAAKKTGT